jgi:hypothetical protein
VFLCWPFRFSAYRHTVLASLTYGLILIKIDKNASLADLVVFPFQFHLDVGLFIFTQLAKIKAAIPFIF